MKFVCGLTSFKTASGERNYGLIKYLNTLTCERNFLRIDRRKFKTCKNYCMAYDKFKFLLSCLVKDFIALKLNG